MGRIGAYLTAAMAICKRDLILFLSYRLRLLTTTYTGATDYLPNSSQAHTFAIAGATILFIVHLLAVLILAGLAAHG